MWKYLLQGSPGIHFDDERQLRLLNSFHYNDELLQIPVEKVAERSFYYMNDAYGPGDSEYLYNMIRFFKPKRIIEIGSGFSTLISREAIHTNENEDKTYRCNHICIEPYEFLYLEELGINVVRKRVEEVDLSFFAALEKDDILFIDSTHMIRPQGDVLFEYLEILPSLRSGVIVHIHDIFTPREYPESWLREVRFWNEQYLLETMLSCGSSFEILGALNYLSHHHRDALGERCPIFKMKKGCCPGSFWIRKK